MILSTLKCYLSIFSPTSLDVILSTEAQIFVENETIFLWIFGEAIILSISSKAQYKAHLKAWLYFSSLDAPIPPAAAASVKFFHNIK